MKLIDADKMLEWLDKQIENAFNQDINAQDAYMITKWAAEEGKFDPTPVQPDTDAKEYERLFDLMDGKGEVITDEN
jgi:hypothetical protein